MEEVVVNLIDEILLAPGCHEGLRLVRAGFIICAAGTTSCPGELVNEVEGIAGTLDQPDGRTPLAIVLRLPAAFLTSPS